MNKRTRKILATVVMTVMLVAVATMVHAYSGNLNMTSSSKLTPGQTVVVNVNIGQLDAGDGIEGISATLQDKDGAFESISVSGTTGWTATYADATKVITAYRTNSDKVKTGTILTISLKVKAGITLDKATLILKDVTLSGGTGESVDIESAQGAQVVIEKEAASTPTTDITPTDTSSNSSTIITTKTDSTTASNKKLPQTGVDYTVVAVITLVAVIGLASLVRYKVFDKDIK